MQPEKGSEEPAVSTKRDEGPPTVVDTHAGAVDAELATSKLAPGLGISRTLNMDDANAAAAFPAAPAAAPPPGPPSPAAEAIADATKDAAKRKVRETVTDEGAPKPAPVAEAAPRALSKTQPDPPFVEPTINDAPARPSPAVAVVARGRRSTPHWKNPWVWLVGSVMVGALVVLAVVLFRDTSHPRPEKSEKSARASATATTSVPATAPSATPRAATAQVDPPATTDLPSASAAPSVQLPPHLRLPRPRPPSPLPTFTIPTFLPGQGEPTN